MRTENWAEVRNSIDRMSAVAKNDPVWTYWYGRAERELGSPLEADGYFQRIAGEHSFYGRLAADELGASLRMPPRAPLPTGGRGRRGRGRCRGSPARWRCTASTCGPRRRASGCGPYAAWTTGSCSPRRSSRRRNEAWDRAIGTADRTRRRAQFLCPLPRALPRGARRDGALARPGGVLGAWA